jgi:hypothetical protein
MWTNHNGSVGNSPQSFNLLDNPTFCAHKTRHLLAASMLCGYDDPGISAQIDGQTYTQLSRTIVV